MPPARHAIAPARTARQAGFTLIELVMVIMIIGALSAVVLPKMVDTTLWQLRAFSDELISQGLSARRLALSQRRPVVATITPQGVEFAYQAGGVIGTLSCPTSVPSCITETGARSITFNAANSGASLTSTATTLTLTISDGAGFSRILRIENETGLFLAAS